MAIPLHFERLSKTAVLPTYAHSTDAAMDISADETLDIKPFERVAVKTGLKVRLPENTEGQIRPRSGLAIKHGITVLNAPGTIDAGYRGEIKILLINLSNTPFRVEQGMRIAQLVVAPILKMDPVFTIIDDQTDRATGGFGSSGL